MLLESFIDELEKLSEIRYVPPKRSDATYRPKRPRLAPQIYQKLRRVPARKPDDLIARRDALLGGPRAKDDLIVRRDKLLSGPRFRDDLIARRDKLLGGPRKTTSSAIATIKPVKPPRP